MTVDWDSPTWGKPGHNVHIADNGSAVDDRHEDKGHG